jgi:hypothetical protein
LQRDSSFDHQKEIIMERITELFVVVENRAGALGELLTNLSKQKINIEAIGLFQDVAKLSVSDVDRAMKALSRGKYQVEGRDVLRLDLDNTPGSFAIVASRLGRAGINIEYCYCTVIEGQKHAAVILDVKDIDRATVVLAGAES